MRLAATRRHVVEVDLAPDDETPLWFDVDGTPLVEEAVDSFELIDQPVVVDAADNYHAAFEDAPAASPDAHLDRGVWAPRQAAVQSWGLGTDGWPRHNSRVVRLFRPPPEPLAPLLAGRRWAGLILSRRIDQRSDIDSTEVVRGRLWMPYPAPPLRVELRLRPFTARYVEAELVLVSRGRFPRRYFDRGSVALSRMRVCEPKVAADPVAARS